MKLLAFESSAKAAGVAVLDDGRLLAEYFQNSGQTHSRTLMQMAEDLLDNCDLTPQDIGACAVADGPGSFTGVRIGVAAAKGFAWGREIPCYGVSTLEAMARSAACLGGVICCCMDARRAQVYNAVFERCGETLVRLREDRAISLDDLCEDLQNIEKTIFLVGDGAELCYTTLLERLPRLTLRIRRGACGVGENRQRRTRRRGKLNAQLSPPVTGRTRAIGENKNRITDGKGE